MYVLIDMEWVKNGQGQNWPTQLSAVRVDADWNTVDTFSTLICPKSSEFAQWEHMAFSGYAPDDFLSASVLAGALYRLRGWLMPEDILCWWHRQAGDLLQMFLKAEGVPLNTVREVCLGDYVHTFLFSAKDAIGNPYRLCAAYGLDTPLPAHCADNDVRTMQILLQGIGFPQAVLRYAPVERGKPTSYKGTAAYPLLYDPETALLHRADCEELPEGRPLPAFKSYRLPILNHYRPCACCRSELLHALAERNRDTIRRAEYMYIYSAQSDVFHTRDCPYVLRAHQLLGCMQYQKCIEHGMRPCGHCKPQPAERMPKLKMPKPMRRRVLSRDEQDALDRFEQAKKQREAARQSGRMDDKAMILTQPGMAFWAGRGYQTFHRKGCPKLAGLTDLRGFARFQEAVRSGFTPCRQCRPSAKQDVVYSIPIGSQERDGENAQTLAELCTAHGLSFAHDERYFVFQTAVGKWRIDMELRPVHLEHINFVSTPGNTQHYHVQPRLFLSLRDTFEYIIKHDRQLSARTEQYREARL